MAVYQLRTFADIVSAIREELQIQSTDSTAISRIKRDVNIAYNEVVADKNWWWLAGNVTLQHSAYVSSGTAAVVSGSSSVTLSIAPGPSKRGYKLAIDGYSEIYTIESHTGGSATLKLDAEYTGASNSAANYRIWTDKVPLPADCKETTKVWHDHHTANMDAMGQQEFRRAVSTSPRAEGKPVIYCTGDFIDPSQTSSIASLPSVLSRKSSGVLKSIVFSTSVPAALSTSLANGEPIRLRVSGAGSPGYNGDVLVASIGTTTITNDTITYTGFGELDETATSDTAISVLQLGQESEYQRYRALYVYPSLTPTRVSLHIDYVKQVLPLINDSDEPLIPVEDRIVLVYGALARAWDRQRNNEMADKNFGKFDAKLAKMAGKLQDSLEKPRLQPSKSYLSGKRAQARYRLPMAAPGITGGSGGGGGSVTGSPNTVAIFDGTGQLTSIASVSTTELSYLDGATSSVQTQLDSKALASDLTAHIADTTDAHDASAISSVASGNLTSTDVQSALNELQSDIDTRALNSDLTTHEADQAAHGATSANTASKIVARDGSGNINVANVYGSGIDSASAGGTVSVGATNATTVNIGAPGATVNIQGTTTYISATNTDVSDQLITLNHGGSSGSGSGTGLEIEEASTITGYAKTSSDRNSWQFKAPNTAGVATLAPGASSDSIVLASASQTLTNKTIAIGSNTITGTLPIANGGTGQTTANAALNALLPSQASASGLYLKSDGTNTSWASAASNLTVVTKTSGYTATGSDDVILCNANSAAFTVNLPAAASNTGKILRFVKTDSSTNAATIDGNASETINGQLTVKLCSQWDEVTIVSDGTNWEIVDFNVSVVACYYMSANATLAASSAELRVNFDTKDDDTHSAVTTGTGTWVFTCPWPGRYEVITNTTAALASGDYTESYIYKGGSKYSYSIAHASSANWTQPANAAQMKLAVGDTVYVTASHGAATSINLIGSTPRTTRITIKRIGN